MRGDESRDLAEATLSQDEARLQSERPSPTDTFATAGPTLTGAAHELNNLLVVVKGNAYLIDQALAGTPHSLRAQKISQAAERCERIVRDIIALTRQRAPQRGVVDLNMVVRDAVALLDSQLRVAGVEVVADLAGDLPVLWADPEQLRLVLVELVTNALEAMRAASPRRLTLRTWTTAGRALLDVGDSGPGLPPDIQARLLAPFGTTPADGRGSGLGLCVSLVQGHRGVLSLVSESGQGAIFRIELPVMPPPA